VAETGGAGGADDNGDLEFGHGTLYLDRQLRFDTEGK
jgi:hypothetical protein